MLLYIALFFLLTFVFGFFLIALLFLKCLGIMPWVKKILCNVFSNQFDKKYSFVQRRPINEECYICLEKCKNQVVTTCDHSFCSHCILDYVDSRRQPCCEVKCPACRKEICVLFRNFEPQNSLEQEYKRKIATFNSLNSKQMGFFRSIMEFTNMFRHMGNLCSAEGIAFMLQNPRIKSILLLLIYALSPIDLVPEMMFGPLGLIDDSYASLEILRQFSNLWLQFVRDEANRERMAH